MELSQSRPFGTGGRKPTHDFLSLYSPAQQDPRPSQGGYLKTHDFLQPLEHVEKNITEGGNKVEVPSVEKPLLPGPAPAPPPSVEHILPGETYSISHISYINQSKRFAKPEGVVFPVVQSSSSDRNDENSNCSSYTGSGFTLWEESAVKKGKTGKENIAGDRHATREAGMKIGGGQWTTSLERPSQSSCNHNHRSTTFGSLSSSHPSSAQKNQSFVNIIKSAKSIQEDEDDDEEEFVIKKEPSSHHKVKIDSTSTDQKPNTPRSKHSATEQRRRSKINDRFSMLRELIPHGEQKRDKASFLLEVIEYIQFLQEKVHKYESYQGWNNEPPKLIPGSNSHRPTEGFIDQPQSSNCVSGPAVFAAKFDENNSSVAPTIPRNGQNLVESDISSADTIKEMGYHPRLTSKPSPFPVPLQPNIFSPGGSGSPTARLPFRLASNTDNTASQPQFQLWESRSCTTDCTVTSDKLKDQELTIESGTISISTVYSQGLLSTLTQSLQSSGVDLSQSSVSVQIDLGRRANNTTQNSSTSILKKNDIPSINQALARSRLASTGEETDKAFKRFKTSRN